MDQVLTTTVPRYQLSLRGGLEIASWGDESGFGIFWIAWREESVSVWLAEASVRISCCRIPRDDVELSRPVPEVYVKVYRRKITHHHHPID